MRRDGKSFEEFRDAVRDDPKTAEWYRDKGKAHNGRELRRIWEKTEKTEKTRPPTDDELTRPCGRI